MSNVRHVPDGSDDSSSNSVDEIPRNPNGLPPMATVIIDHSTRERARQSNERLRSQLGMRMPSAHAPASSSGRGYNPWANSLNEEVRGPPPVMPPPSSTRTEGLSRMSRPASTPIYSVPPINRPIGPARPAQFTPINRPARSFPSAPSYEPYRTQTAFVPTDNPFGRTPGTSAPRGHIVRIHSTSTTATATAPDPFSRANQPIAPEDLRRRRSELMRECRVLIQEYETAVKERRPARVIEEIAARCRVHKDILDALNNRLVDGPAEMPTRRDDDDDEDEEDEEENRGYNIHDEA